MLPSPSQLSSSPCPARPSRGRAIWCRAATWLGLAGLCCLAWSFLALAQPPAPAPAPAPASPAETLAELRAQARFALLDQDHAQALKALDQALTLAPQDHDLIMLKLQALRLAGGGQALDFLRGLWVRDPAAHAHLRFEAGYIRVREKKFDKALVHFRHAERVDRPRAIREQGLTYIKMGDYPQALAAFRRLDQGSPAVLYLVGQALYLRKQYQPAQEALDKALAANPSPQESQDIAGLAQAVAAGQKAQRPWRAWATAMVQYEDNVFRDPLQSYPGAQPPRGKGDFSFLFKQDLLYRLGQRDSLSWGLSGQAQYLGYAQLHGANYASFSLGAYLDYQGADWGWGLPYAFSYYWAESALRRKVQVNSLLPMLWLRHGPHWRSEAVGLIQHRGYLQAGEPDVWRWRLGLTHFLSRDPGLLPHLRLGYALNQDIASDQASGFLNYEVSLGGAAPLTKQLSLDLSLTYLKYVFDRRVDPYLLGGAGGELDRRDEQYLAGGRLLFRPGQDWQAALAYQHALNHSNLRDNGGFEPYDFKANTVSLMLTWSF